jgi:hypothetical protein
MTTQQKIQKLVTDLKYADCGFEDVRDEPGYVVNEIMKLISQTRQADVDNIIQWINENYQGVVADMIIKHLKTLKENI